ncbi:hypothetical protein D3C75_457840 [compost metagenome]
MPSSPVETKPLHIQLIIGLNDNEVERFAALGVRSSCRTIRNLSCEITSQTKSLPHKQVAAARCRYNRRQRILPLFATAGKNAILRSRIGFDSEQLPRSQIVLKSG